MTNATKPTPPRFALLAGDDVICRQKARADIIAMVRAIEPTVEIVRYNAEEQEFSHFSEQVLTPSLLSPMRIFLITEVNELNEKEYDSLGALFTYDLPDACVIMEADKIRGAKKGKDGALTKKFVSWVELFEERSKKLPTAFIIQEFAKPPEYKMAEWVESNVGQLLGRKINKKDAEYLVDMVGTDPALLYSELQKIDVFLDNKVPVTKEVIDTVVGSTRLMTHFELAQALGKKDAIRVLEIIDSIYVGNVYLPLFVGAIFRHFWAMFKIAKFANANPDIIKRFKGSLKNFNRTVQEETGVAIGVAAGLLSEKQGKSVYPVIVKSGIIDQALSFSNNNYVSIFSSLKQFDVGVKTGAMDDSKTSFQLFCYSIMRVSELQKEM